MKKIPAIAIFDVGKTNKKLLLFDEDYKIVYEETAQLKEINDEDGFACEDIDALTAWIKNSFDKIINDERFEIVAVNFSAYGASFVYLDDDGNVCAPLYNYLKPYPEDLQNEFYKKYGGKKLFAKLAASPVLGNLNSGMQLYRLKYKKPELFTKIKYALHLPQYLSYILAAKNATDITSIGCHTNLWNFEENKYHDWVKDEDIDKKFPAIISCDTTTTFEVNNKKIVAGFGLHDSSAALIPYLDFVDEPFILISTGTWCISLNPFNNIPLTDDELEKDCLCYLSYDGKPVKASRLFAGYEHEEKVKLLSTQFNKPPDYFAKVIYNEIFFTKSTKTFSNYEEAYHHLIDDIILKQIKSTKLVLNNTAVKKIFVDGGFGKNEIYMQLLANAFPQMEVYAASVSQASAIGAALVIHAGWNKKPVPGNLVYLKLYNPASFAN
jgi:sugar (pentulose or hexulose) kinase